MDFDGTVDSFRLTAFADFMISTARKAGMPTDRPDCTLTLSDPQRRTLLGLAETDATVRERLVSGSKTSQTVTFTAEELASVCHALAGPLATAQGRHRNQLLRVAEKVAQGLTQGLAGSKKQPLPTRPKAAFQLRITLKDVRPTVWRRFQVVDCNLLQLHEVVQRVIGWQNSDLYYFKIGDASYSDLSRCEDLDCLHGRKVKLSHLMKQGHRQFEYVYDFTDEWRHVIEIESAFEPEESAQFPVCLEGGGTCPPEDVGGAAGYKVFLRAINDPSHSDHQRYLDWIGGWFDPEAFDLDLVNRALARMAGRAS